MKVGFSFGRCVNDILNGRVDINDVLVIVSRTRIDKVDQVRPIIQSYIWDRYIQGDLDEAVRIGEALYTNAKLHQPRLFGQHAIHVESKDIWLNLVPASDLMDESVANAWKQIQVMERLALDKKPELPEHLKLIRKIDHGPRPPLDDNF